MCVGECEYARVCVCICRVFAVVTAGMKEWRRRVWLEEVPTEQVSLYFHRTQVCLCVCVCWDICSRTLCTSVFVSVNIDPRGRLVRMYRADLICLMRAQYGAVKRRRQRCKWASCLHDASVLCCFGRCLHGEKGQYAQIAKRKKREKFSLAFSFFFFLSMRSAFGVTCKSFEQT